MINPLLALLVLALTAPTYEQSTPVSPCPNVFEYEPPGTEPGRWYGVVHLSTDSTLHSLWLNIVLDSKADIVGNWVGDVTTKDNIDFKIENTNMKISPGPAVAVRFFVQYNTLNKVPKLVEIRLNGREICNAKTPQPADSSRPIRPETRPQTPSRPQTQTTVTRQQTGSRPQTSDIKPEDRTETRPIQGRPTNEGPVYVRPSNNAPIPSSIEGGSSSQSFDTNTRPNSGGKPTSSSNSNTTPRRPGSSSFNSGNVNTNVEVPSSTYDLNSRPSSGGRITTSRPIHTTTTEIPEYSDNNSNDRDEDYFEGYRPTIVISENKHPQCGRVLLNSPVPLVVNGTPTLEGQWPWQIALYQTQTVDNKYICGGTLVSHRHIITAAHCVTRKNSKRIVNKNTLTVYLGKHNLRTSVDGVQIEFIDKITVHPQYNASTFSRDVSILQLRKPVTYTNWVQPACLWPEDSTSLSSVIDKKGSVVGWGFDETGVATEELSLVEMPVVDTETCIRSYSEFFVRFTSEYTYCAGYRDGVFDKRTGVRDSTSVCNGDSGGGMVFKIDGFWYLRGLVSLSVARQNEFRCDPSHYVIFTDLAKLLPWIKKNISDL